jgi:hypothetical protein
MRQKLLPVPFFIGLAVGLAGLSWLGSIVVSTNLTDHFVRFYQLITVEAGYFPTARQVRAIVDKTSDDDSLIYVIVGGSSVLNGAGQHETMIWTSALQEHLGPRFRVINFAQRAGSSSEFGNVAAEYLLRNSKRVIYVSEASTTTYGIALVEARYRHIIFDAWERDFLLPWPPRDELLAESSLKGPREIGTRSNAR